MTNRETPREFILTCPSAGGDDKDSFDRGWDTERVANYSSLTAKVWPADDHWQYDGLRVREVFAGDEHETKDAKIESQAKAIKFLEKSLKERTLERNEALNCGREQDAEIAAKEKECENLRQMVRDEEAEAAAKEKECENLYQINGDLEAECDRIADISDQSTKEVIYLREKAQTYFNMVMTQSAKIEELKRALVTALANSGWKQKPVTLWRDLEIGETIEKGDQMLFSEDRDPKEWIDCDATIGMPCTGLYVFRRPVVDLECK